MLFIFIGIAVHQIELLQVIYFAAWRDLKSAAETLLYQLTGIVSAASDNREGSHPDIKALLTRLRRMKEPFPGAVLERQDTLLDRMRELRSDKTRASRELGKVFWFDYERPLLEPTHLTFDWEAAVRHSLLNRRAWTFSKLPKELDYFGQIQPQLQLPTQSPNDSATYASLWRQ